MGSAQFKLDKFEGPLDLLLHLISKHKLNIYDIEISLLLEQYLEYIENLDHDDFEGAADFLEMAARLIYIKTCQLLPHDEESKNLKKELEGRIIEYSLCKIAANALRERYEGGNIFVRDPVKLPVDKTYTREHDPQVLYDAYMGLSEKAVRNAPLKANMFEPIVTHKIVSVTSKIIYILKRLYINGECSLEHLYDGMTVKSERIATFLAVLELTKSGRIFLNDDNTNIYFNKNSRKKKIKSDFDNEEPMVQSNENVAEDAHELQKNNEAVSFEKLELDEQEADNVYKKPEYKSFSDYKPQKPRSEHIVSCAAEINEKVIVSDVISISDKESTLSLENISDKNQSEENEYSDKFAYDAELLEEPYPENVDIDDILVNDSETTTETEISNDNFIEKNIIEEIQKSARFVYEYETLSMLSKEPSKDLFKPNYWRSRRYFWGYSPVGDNGSNNYWRFG